MSAPSRADFLAAKEATMKCLDYLRNLIFWATVDDAHFCRTLDETWNPPRLSRSSILSEVAWSLPRTLTRKLLHDLDATTLAAGKKYFDRVERHLVLVKEQPVREGSFRDTTAHGLTWQIAGEVWEGVRETIRDHYPSSEQATDPHRLNPDHTRDILPAIRGALGEYRDLDFEYLKDAVVIEAEKAIASFCPASNGGQSGKPKRTATEEAVLEIIETQPKGRGITGKSIIAELKKKDIEVEYSTLRKHIIPVLKEHYGVVNDRARGGYLIARV